MAIVKMTKHEKKVCDRLWQEKITGGICSFPGCNRIGIDGHHIMKCRYLNTRWDIANGRALCREHHSWVETHPAEYENMIIREIGSWEYALLREKALIIKKQFYDEIREELK